MADLFSASRAANIARAAPLAARMRPRRLSDYIGQEKVIGKGMLLRRLIEADRLGSVILYGPPGIGKTTLAEIIAHETKRRFIELSATASGVKELREVLEAARRALGALEIGVLSSSERPLRFSLEMARESVQRKAITYDSGDTHYDCASALIKSIRGSDSDAGLYWLARMLEGGEDVRFLTRRLVILASEDIGNADPRALVIAVATMQATEFVGLPECQLVLAQAVIYLALAPKSNACTVAIDAARRDVREKAVLPVPRHLQDKHYAGARRLGHGDGYEYAHDAPDGIAVQEYLGVEKRYYVPTDRGLERDLGERLAEIRRRLAQAVPLRSDSGPQ